MYALCMKFTRRDILKIAAACDVDPRTVADEVARPAEWGITAANRSRARVREFLLAHEVDGQPGAVRLEDDTGGRSDGKATGPEAA